MIIFDPNFLGYCVLVMVVVIALLYGNMQYWKSKAETLYENNYDNEEMIKNLQSHNHYLEHLLNPKAARFAKAFREE